MACRYFGHLAYKADLCPSYHSIPRQQIITDSNVEKRVFLNGSRALLQVPSAHPSANQQQMGREGQPVR